jgi:hypothetical protein
VAGRVAHHRFTSRADGDLAAASVGVAARRAAVVDLPWTWLRQVHGADVVHVRHPGEGAGAAADAAVTDVPGAALAVAAADCAPVVLRGTGVVGVAHAGWRGLASGVLEATVAALRALGPGPLEAVLGPCIHACCYEFGRHDLDQVLAATGGAGAGRTAAGSPALDVPAAVAATLGRLGVPLDASPSGCTACGGDRWFSHRARAEVGRQVAVAWLA